MLDSMLYNSMGWGITKTFFFYLEVLVAAFLSKEEMDSVLSL